MAWIGGDSVCFGLKALAGFLFSHVSKVMLLQPSDWQAVGWGAVPQSQGLDVSSPCLLIRHWLPEELDSQQWCKVNLDINTCWVVQQIAIGWHPHPPSTVETECSSWFQPPCRRRCTGVVVLPCMTVPPGSLAADLLAWLHPNHRGLLKKHPHQEQIPNHLKHRVKYCVVKWFSSGNSSSL